MEGGQVPWGVGWWKERGSTGGKRGRDVLVGLKWKAECLRQGVPPGLGAHPACGRWPEARWLVSAVLGAVLSPWDGRRGGAGDRVQE